MKKRLIAVAVLLALGSEGAWASPVGHHLERARSQQQQALSSLHALQADLARIGGQLATAERLLDASTVQVVDARNRERDAAIQLALARDVLIRRVRLAYEQGPASTLDLLLSAKNAGDLLSIDEFTSHVMLSDLDALNQVRNGKVQLDRIRQGLEMRQAELARNQRTVQDLLERMQIRVDQARATARSSGKRVQSLEATARRIARARQRELEREALLSSGASGADQAKLLALLGPNGGRGCEIPSGLRSSGRSIEGEASWYGGDFAGQSTASGATFDPSLFTAAHRTLPLGVFLRVHYEGRCAIVLVNDRGPYGHYERIIDLAQAPAQYLGVGVAYVTADILVPR